MLVCWNEQPSARGVTNAGAAGISGGELLRLQAEAEDPDDKPDISITVHDLADKRKRGRETTPIDLTEDD